MTILVYLPALLQGLATIVDEFFFHHLRGLKRWERIGHPLDTATVVAAYLFLNLTVPSLGALKIFAGLAAFSSLFVTKDEWVHATACRPEEQWLHAVLFILHPTAFAAAAWIWWNDPASYFLKGQLLVLLFFFLYQVLYWGFFAKHEQAASR